MNQKSARGRHKKRTGLGEARPWKFDQNAAHSGRVRCALRGLGGSGLGLQSGLDRFDQAGEGDFVTDREIAQDLAVELDVGGVETFDEAAIGDAVATASSVEAHDPKTAAIGLLLLARDVGVLPGMLDGFFRIAEELGFVAEIALGVFQDFLVSLFSGGSVRCTSHVGLFLLVNRRQVGLVHLPDEVLVDALRGRLV